jgi:hypothetical protein
MRIQKIVLKTVTLHNFVQSILAFKILYTIRMIFYVEIVGLEIRDRMWLKITIPNAFIGADVVEWILARVQGISDRREARKYASHMLKVWHYLSEKNLCSILFGIYS